jgi:transcription elongation factor
MMDKGMTKYADLPQAGEEVEIVAGAYKGRKGIVKKAIDGALEVETPQGPVTVSESACAAKK